MADDNLRTVARVGVWQGIGTVKSLPIEQQAGASKQDENGFFPNGAPRAFKPQSMADDPSVPGQVVGGKGRATGDALMDRFYGKGGAGGGPAMQMPGGGAGKGTLHIKLDGALAGTTVRADLDDLFKSHKVSKVRPQMDLDRV